MNLPDILNVAIGLVVLYFLLSSIASLLLELLTGATRYREEILFVTINRLLAGVPDEPWNVSRLALDRVARRLPGGRGPFGLWEFLRTRWQQEYKIAAPSSPASASATENEPPPVAPADPGAPVRADIVQRFWSHPKIRSLAPAGADAPAKMEATTFASVLIDIAAPRDAQGALPDNRLALERALAAPSADTPRALLTTLRAFAHSSDIAPGATGEALWTPFRAHIVTWFDEATARASEVYRRTMQRFLLGLGFALALLANADTFRTVHVLAHNRPLADATAAYAATLVAETQAAATEATAKAQKAPPPPATANSPTATATGGATTASSEAADDLRATRMALSEDLKRLRELERIGFPLGWSAPDRGFHQGEAWLSAALARTDAWQWPAVGWALVGLILFKLVGLGATALAVAQGGPFWHDMMQRLIGLRKGQATEPAAAKAIATGAAGAASATQAATLAGRAAPGNRSAGPHDVAVSPVSFLRLLAHAGFLCRG